MKHTHPLAKESTLLRIRDVEILKPNFSTVRVAQLLDDISEIENGEAPQR